jgi:hypothetical protein
MIILKSSIVLAGDWEFSFMGINPKHFKDRDWKIIVVGAVVSLAVHEASHVLYAEMNGGGHFDFGDLTKVAIMENYHDESHSSQQMFHRAGFISQLIVGGILTAIPNTRHTDFTLGFNSFTTINTAAYLITGGGINKNASDITQLDNGNMEGVVYTIGSGVLSYINLKKPIE